MKPGALSFAGALERSPKEADHGDPRFEKHAMDSGSSSARASERPNLCLGLA